MIGPRFELIVPLRVLHMLWSQTALTLKLLYDALLQRSTIRLWEFYEDICWLP